MVLENRLGPLLEVQYWITVGRQDNAYTRQCGRPGQAGYIVCQGIRAGADAGNMGGDGRQHMISTEQHSSIGLMPAEVIGRVSRSVYRLQCPVAQP